MKNNWRNTPLYGSKVGLTGEGEVIGISDTGIDMNNCYFYDADHSPPYNVYNPLHRKVVYYNTYMDKEESFPEAHGTHVCGTAAGYSSLDYGDLRKYNGGAYDAKIAFFDIDKGNAQNLNHPDNINTELFQVLYSVGHARIFSNSWGSQNANNYDGNAENVDQFMWNNPDALVLFAAGNYGPSSKTVTSPGLNKNGISVGASLNAHDSWLAYTLNQASDVYGSSSLAYFSSQGPTGDGKFSIMV